MSIVFLGATWLMLAAQAPTSAAEPNIAALAWLSGEWEQETRSGANAADWTVERWSLPRAGVMLGTSLSGRRTTSEANQVTDRPRSYEFMRISSGEGGHLTYFASPGGRPSVAFPLARLDRYEVSFENPAHDYPQRITYRWDASAVGGESLTATISLLDGSRSMTWTYRRQQTQSRP